MAEKQQHVHQDVVEYSLFPILDRFLDEDETVQVLEEYLNTYLAHLSNDLVGYIWQDEPFRLKIVCNENLSGGDPAHLYGRTHYGDNVGDEWFIVFLLYELTRTFPGLVVRVTDSDGEFLLIEAANTLPKWVNPDTVENRVYICGGQLHIIPVPQSPAEMAALPLFTPSLEEALACVRDHPTLTTAAPEVQQDIESRISGYPEKTGENAHRSHCYIPAALAVVLKEKPNMIAPIVQAFYLRDPIDLKSCVTMQHFRPGTRVMTEVRFTRCLYAQLMQQKFQPDKRSGFTLPSSGHPMYKAQDLGMKLAHGAEILCSRCSSKQTKSHPTNQNMDGKWNTFLVTLKNKGYFKGEIEGSELYTKLLQEARKFYEASVTTQESAESADPGTQMLQILQNTKYDIEQMRQQERFLTKPDDDSWLTISADQLDEMLNKAAGGLSVKRPEHFDLSEMSRSVQSFVENVSSHEGAEFPKSSPSPMTPEDAEIQFDPGSFMQNMQKMFEFNDPSSSDSDDMDEYGSDDSDDDIVSHKRLTKQAGKPGVGKTIEDYMSEMDRELAHTNVGKSFEKKSLVRSQEQPTRPARTQNKSSMKPQIPPPPVPANKPDIRPVQTTVTKPHTPPPPVPSPRQSATGLKPQGPPPPVPLTKPGGAPPPLPNTNPRIENTNQSAQRTSGQPVAPPRRKKPTAAPPRPPPPKPPTKHAPKASVEEDDDIDDIDDDFRPVDVDMNVVKNLLQSYNAQDGLAGPGSNLLQGMGVCVSNPKT